MVQNGYFVKDRKHNKKKIQNDIQKSTASFLKIKREDKKLINSFCTLN